MSEPSVTLRNPHAQRKPLIHTNSCAGRLQRLGVETEADKAKSLLDVSGHEDGSIERRSRSKSMPLTMEATEVAKKLKRLSDSLSSRYVNKALVRPRRHTIASPDNTDNNRLSFHFDEKGYNSFVDPIDEAPEYQRGTSV